MDFALTRCKIYSLAVNDCFFVCLFFGHGYSRRKISWLTPCVGWLKKRNQCLDEKHNRKAGKEEKKKEAKRKPT